MLLHCHVRLRFRNGRRSFRRGQQTTDSSKTERIKSHFGNRRIFRPMHPCSQTLRLDNACKPKSQRTDHRDLTGAEIRRMDKVPARSLWVVTCRSSKSRSSRLTTSGATTGWLRHELSGCGRGKFRTVVQLSRKSRRIVGTHGQHNLVEIRRRTLGQTFRPTAGRTNVVPRLWSQSSQFKFRTVDDIVWNAFTKTAVSDTTDLGSMLLLFRLTDTNRHFHEHSRKGIAPAPRCAFSRR